MAFDNIIGNENVKILLDKVVKSNNIIHSYMFTGEEGIGKKLFAVEFAKMVLCTSEEEKPCNHCKSCIEFNGKSNPDFEIIEADGNIKIEQIRLFQAKVAEKPITSNKKVYIIDDAHTMTKEAQNCLLKTLEEPPEYIMIILITSNENMILNTIKSRCMKINFSKIENNLLKKFLEENYGITNVSSSMLDTFGGSIKKAILLKDKEELYSSVEKIISELEKVNIIDILNGSEIIYKSKEDIFDILDYINVILFNLANTRMKKVNYLNCINIVEKTKANLKANSNFDMSIDNMLLKMWEELNN